VVAALLPALWPAAPLRGLDEEAKPARSMAPLALHPENPRYFLFRGKPAILITSGEHYGAVLNRDFDYLPYLDELAARGFNLTRTFSGVYREVPGSFGIPDNILAPSPAAYLAPWARGDAGGAGDGGARFDLERWEPAYFRRLEDFVAEAGRRGIVVELVLFCTIYDDALWAVSPMNPLNNVQGIGPASRLEAYSGKDEALTAAQAALARKLAAALNAFDNVYYEVCNEPYERPGLTKEWNDRIIAAIVEVEAPLPRKHLIAQGIAVRSAKVVDPHPQVSVFDFHAALPEAVTLNDGLRKAIADDETGGKGNADFPYRSEAWEFLLAGGSVFSHLDFSFTSKDPRGTSPLRGAPGGGGPAIRKQLEVLKRFLESFDLLAMRPDRSVIQDAFVLEQPSGKRLDARAAARALAEAGKAYAVYVKGGNRAELSLDLPPGRYRVEWLDPRSGEAGAPETIEHAGGKRKLVSPPYVEDIALRVKRAPAGER
jgi:hypothetical protein